MPDHLLGPQYTNSKELVKKGDRVQVDGRKGQVDEVCMPNSLLANYYSCTDVGGLLIIFDDGILELLPFGTYHEVMKESHGNSKGQE